MRVLILADDLTGALDSAATLTGAGLRCLVARRPGDVPAALARRPDVLSVSTASREAGAEQARAAIDEALAGIGALPEFVIKKIDSRLKGQIAAETAALAAHAGIARALVAPAIPAQGRVVSRGRLTGTGVGAPVDVAATLAGSGLALSVPDTRTDADLDAALAAALDGSPLLLVGAAGMAAAVARRLASGAWSIPVPRIAAPLLFAIGSHDPITIAQVERLAAAGRARVTPAPEGRCPPVEAGETRVLRLVAVEGRPFDPRAAGRRFAEGVAQLVRRGGYATLLASGGETADAVLAALGQGVIDIEGEVLPGVPVSTMLIGGRRMQLVSKSGGFGDADALVSVAVAAADSRRSAS